MTRRAVMTLARTATIAVVFLFASRLASPVRAAVGVLRVTSFPSGAEVWIDGASTGKRTPAWIPLSPGEHVVTLRAPGSGWAPSTRTVS